MTRFSCLLGVVLCCLTANAATTNAPPKIKPHSLPPGDRFLFVVDTSSGMSRVAYASRQAIVDLIWSGLQGHMRPGDTYGLWTFNKVVHAGLLPMQTWQTNAIELAGLVGRFLREQKYEGPSNFGLVATNLQPVVNRVRDLVVILISDGRTPMEGTPFDAAINAAYQQRASAARKAKQPLVTALVARGGELVRWSVAQAGENLDLPEHSPPPPPPVVAVTNASPVVAKPSRPPIIITRSHVAESTPVSSNTAPVDAQPTPPASALVPATSGLPQEPAAMAGSETGVAPPAATSLLSASFVRTAAPSITLRSKDTALAATAPDLGPVTSSTPAAFRLLSPLPVAAREPSASTEVNSTNTGVLAAVPAPSPAAPFSPLWMLTAGVALLSGAIALTAIFIHRQRHSHRPSIISQSIEHRGRNR